MTIPAKRSSAALLMLGLSCAFSGRAATAAPVVTDLAPVSPTIVAFTIHERALNPVPRDPYIAQPGDIVTTSPATVPAWSPKGIRLVPKFTRLRRAGAQHDTGFIYTTRNNPTPHLWAESITGRALDLEALDTPASYQLSCPTDARYATPAHPLAVHRKTKPANGNDITGEKTLVHRVYLTLPHPLVENTPYTLAFPALQLREPRVTFTPNSRTTVNEAIHVNQIGYRPSDPFKRAYLSLWTGSGGGIAFATASFALIDTATGTSVFTAPITTGFPADRPESFREKRNFVGADVHYLDFPSFSTSGEYRVHIPGLGVSLPFRIDETDTWAAAFRTALHGFLAHRSGLALGPPFTSYQRPRNMHPADGTKVFRLPVTMLEGEAGNIQRAVLALLDSGVPPDQWEIQPDAWGGYMDAGDWDRRSLHLSATRHLAELFSINPAYFEKISLALPPAEAADDIPDLLNEVAWNAAFYRRLQDPDGGVRGGIESTEHPRPGEASWEETLVLGAYAPDPYSSFSYASSAALLSRLLAPYDPSEASAYAASARLAWDWAEANAARVLDEAEARSALLPAGTSRLFRRPVAENRVREMRFVAAGDIYALTGDPALHDLFRTLAGTAGHEPDELGALFRYARLPAEQTNSAFRTAAIAKIVRQAEIALRFGSANAFGLHTQVPATAIMGYNAFYSVPEMVTGPVLPRAHILTGEERFLRGALHAAHFSAGANPLNMTFTTGVGHYYPRNALHIDSRVTGQPAPAGITIYGPMDAAADYSFTRWVHDHHLQSMLPTSRAWPAAEWHVDLFRWPAMSEYTIHQTFRPTAYYWGYLAARP